jgi:hypothetical protein
MGGGQQVGSLESLILKREIKGPGWMLLKGAKRTEFLNQVRFKSRLIHPVRANLLHA